MTKPQTTFSHLKPRSGYSGDESVPRGQFDHLNDGGPATASAAQILRAAAQGRSAPTTPPLPDDPAARGIILAGRKLRSGAV